MDVVQDKDAVAFSTMQFVQPGFMLCSKHVIWIPYSGFLSQTLSNT